MYLLREGFKTYCLLPNHLYKQIPYSNWIEKIDWQQVYYDVFKALTDGVLTDDELFYEDLEYVLNKIDFKI